MKRNDLWKLFILFCLTGWDNAKAYQPTGIDISDLNFVIIKSGSFIMGSSEEEKNKDFDEDQVKVTISKSFEIMATEVTQLHWFKVMGDNPSGFNKKKYCEDDYSVIFADNREVGLCPNHPVERVSWNRVQEFIKRLNRRENLTGCDGTPKGSSGCYRLPTEAEWEFAARGGLQSAYYFGNDPAMLTAHAWFYDNANKQTHAVGGKDANDNGLYDVYGNVWEWVQDKYRKKLLGGSDPLHTSFGPYRVLRGGSWFNFTRDLHSSNRYGNRPEYIHRRVGFRIVRTVAL